MGSLQYLFYRYLPSTCRFFFCWTASCVRNSKTNAHGNSKKTTQRASQNLRRRRVPSPEEMAWLAIINQIQYLYYTHCKVQYSKLPGRRRGVTLDLVVCPPNLEYLPPFPTKHSLAQRTSGLSYHTVHLHPGYHTIAVRAIKKRRCLPKFKM